MRWVAISIGVIVTALCVVGLSVGWLREHPREWTGVVDVTETHISPKIGGRIVGIAADEGDRIEAGQVLVELDQITLLDELAMARASLKDAEGKLATVKARHAFAVEEFERLDRLNKEASASRQEVLVARTQRDALAGQVTSAQGQVEMAEANIARIEHDLAEATIAAPHGGRVLARAYEPGEVVAPGVTVLSVADLDNVWVYAHVEEADVHLISVGDELFWRLAQSDEVTGKGRVVQVLPEAEFATQKDKGRAKRDIKTFRVKLAVRNVPNHLKPGMTVDVFRPSATTQPQSAAQ